MAKLIKKDSTEAAPQATNQAELTQITDNRRVSVINRETLEARQDAQQIRERALAQASQIVATAKDQAAELLAQAASQVSQMQEQGHETGLQAGHQEGLAAFNTLLVQLTERAEQIEQDMAPQLTTLAVHMARKILGKELEFHPEAVVQIVKQALIDKARQRREITLRVNPEDLALLREHKAELLDMLSRCRQLSFVEDPQIGRYGVMIETEAGSINAQLEDQLTAFERAMNAVRGQ